MHVSHLHLMEMWGKVQKFWDRVQVSRILRYIKPKHILLQNMPFLDTLKYSSKHFWKLIFAMTFSSTSDVPILFLPSKTEDPEGRGLWKHLEVAGCEVMWVRWVLEGTSPCSDENVTGSPPRSPSSNFFLLSLNRQCCLKALEYDYVFTISLLQHVVNFWCISP